MPPETKWRDPDHPEDDLFSDSYVYIFLRLLGNDASFLSIYKKRRWFSSNKTVLIRI